ncbi:unnamed protein product [Camellia sinensis]
MVELQSCPSLVNDSAFCGIEEEVKGESVNIVAEISAELQKERQKNAELIERISILEAQILKRDNNSLPSNGQGNYPSAKKRSFKKFKSQKAEFSSQKIEDGNSKTLQTKHDTRCTPPRETNIENFIVNWMTMDDSQFLHHEKLKNGDSVADCDNTDDSDDEDDEYVDDYDSDIDNRDKEKGENEKNSTELEHLPEEGLDKKIHLPYLESFSSSHVEPKYPLESQELNKDIIKHSLAHDIKPINNNRELKEHDRKESKLIGEYQVSLQIPTPGRMSMQKKSPKVAFCPKEVKRILESEVLQLKNAQSHTIRKIIVFASLGIRHGCEEMYELDFNHLSILQKGEPYMSSENPGEHVLYENPGVRRKVFYPNRQNPTLCPVQILEEEKAMRPSDASCPSCLFLCIKYGGRTRNLPQNEYVRQRMGRNKLKSFGPVMCQMVTLVHVRSGSFFFKALGITLLFMAGFPDDQVQKETKYRNLDLLQKYYRTDDDTEGEELFLSHPLACDTEACSNPHQLTGKRIPAKSKGKKHTNPVIKPHNSQKPSIQQSNPSSSAFTTQFGLMGYTSIQTHATVSNPVVSNTGHHCISYRNQTSYPMFPPPHPANSFVPMLYWPPANAFPPCPYPSSSYGYQSFPSTGNYTPVHPQPYYSHTLIPKVSEVRETNDGALKKSDSDSVSSSSGTEPKQERTSFE